MSFELLEFVSQRKGDYLVKIEGITTVRWSRLPLVAQLEAPVYFGEMREHLDGLKGPIQICTPVCTDLKLGPDVSTFYMNGGFYGLSMDTVRKLVSCEYAQKHKSGREDILTAIWLKMCALPVISVSFPPGIIHRHGNIEGSRQRIAYAASILPVQCICCFNAASATDCPTTL